jgi:hypothetical protein
MAGADIVAGAPGILGHFPSRAECVIADLLESQAGRRGEQTFAARERLS